MVLLFLPRVHIPLSKGKLRHISLINANLLRQGREEVAAGGDSEAYASIVMDLASLPMLSHCA